MSGNCAKPANSPRRRWLAFVLLLGVVVGCHRGPQPAGTVRGRVTVGGQPVAAGSVLFEADRPRWGTVGMVAADGRFEVADVPAGAVRVGVRTRGVRRFDAPAGQQPAAVPKRFEDPAGSGLAYTLATTWSTSVAPTFEDPAGSGLAYTVRPGDQTVDIELPVE